MKISSSGGSNKFHVGIEIEICTFKKKGKKKKKRNHCHKFPFLLWLFQIGPFCAGSFSRTTGNTFVLSQNSELTNSSYGNWDLLTLRLSCLLVLRNRSAIDRTVIRWRVLITSCSDVSSRFKILLLLKVVCLSGFAEPFIFSYFFYLHPSVLAVAYHFLKPSLSTSYLSLANHWVTLSFFSITDRFL